MIPSPRARGSWGHRLLLVPGFNVGYHSEGQADLNSSTLAPAMKKCPFCAEDIQDAAIKCRHCGSDVGKQRCAKCNCAITDEVYEKNNHWDPSIPWGPGSFSDPAFIALADHYCDDCYIQVIARKCAKCSAEMTVEDYKRNFVREVPSDNIKHFCNDCLRAGYENGSITPDLSLAQRVGCCWFLACLSGIAWLLTT